MSTPVVPDYFKAAQCKPSKTLEICRVCARYNPRLPELAEVRIVQAINATVVWRGGTCPMYAATKVERPWCEPAEREEVAA